MQLAVACLVSLAADIMQSREEWRELVEILQVRHVLFAHVIAAFASHACNYARRSKTRIATFVGYGVWQTPCRAGLYSTPLCRLRGGAYGIRYCGKMGGYPHGWRLAVRAKQSEPWPNRAECQRTSWFPAGSAPLWAPQDAGSCVSPYRSLDL